MIGTTQAEDAVRAALRRKLPVPQAIEDASKMWQVVIDAGHRSAPPRPTPETIPATPAELRQLITEQAEAKRHAESVRSVASDYLEPVAENYRRLVRDAVPGWILSLTPEFNTLVKVLTGQAKKLPEDLRVEALDWNNPKISAAWEKAESAAHQLDQLVSDRKDMARAIGGDGGRDNELYAVAKFPDPTEQAVFDNVLLNEVAPVMHGWRELKGQPVSRWLHLARSEHVQLVLATPGEVRDRAAAVQRWRDAIAAMQAASGRNGAVVAVRQALAA